MLPFLIAAGLGIVAIVLLLGIWNMAKGGSPNRSQTFMRWRVITQFLVVILVMCALYFTS